MLRRFLGLPQRDARIDSDVAERPRPQARATDAAESESVRRLVARLESLPPDRARFLACFAYTLARAAQADLEISDVETQIMERLVIEDGGLAPDQATFVVELAKTQVSSVGGTDDYLVTREFLGVSTVEQRVALVRACLAVAAADGSISADESAVADQVANELQLNSVEMAAIRTEFHERMAAIQALRRRLAAEPT
jgi:uncharacterized tellurite resistance protein B-like protein